MNDHIVASYDDELKSARTLIARMFGLAEKMLDDAMQALVARDKVKAQAVRDTDKELDRIELEAEELAINILARRSPVANDLRDTVAVLKITGMIERMGDYSKNIAKRTQALANSPYSKTPECVKIMGQEARNSIRNISTAFIEYNDERAMSVWEEDEKLDTLHNAAFRQIMAIMIEEPEYIGSLTHFLMIAKNLERIGDQATNIAEIIHFSVTGHPIEQKRNKRDQTTKIID
ncbi:phosphate signaling complex protein PhoU [Temperatibacter marinus]|uniref:Phosphate-specific transport system accessory protein PhoU n=1 Tax=Temperatibacter marinus TaxID=1456591 RepID=A0AA52EIL2_9PROT|nr:phosphate signaling complex protein PhoU [Temperatibacter marinus]WND03475.1 phosphate signaling complex protein PhoU [Temperatibacter marinus]